MARSVVVFLCVILYVPCTLCQNVAKENKGIPDVPPPGVEEYDGIPNVPPPGVEQYDGIPNFAPPGVEENKGIPINRPVSRTFQTTLPPLTPVPSKILNMNLNFGSQGINLEPCETVEGGSGSCTVVEQCKPFVQLLQQSPNAAARQVLQKALCGFEGSKSKVCCPLPDTPTSLPRGDTETTKSINVTAGTTEDPDPIRPSPEAPADEDYIDSFPKPPVCGITKGSFIKVVGGVDAKLGDFPWMALLYYLGKVAGWKCGGSLVSSKHVLTAAHCIYNMEDRYLVRLGELDLARDDDGATPLDVLIKTKIKHEDYNPNTYINDIGLLVLQRQVTFTSLIRPICIPVDSELRERSYVDYNPIIAGWGRTAYQGPMATHLQTLQVPVISNKKCANAFKKYITVVIDESVLCAGYLNGGKDSCQGDSGGPLMQQIYNAKEYTTPFYQTGLVSYGKGCAEAGFPGVYTRVTFFVPWLQEKMLGKI